MKAVQGRDAEAFGRIAAGALAGAIIAPGSVTCSQGITYGLAAVENGERLLVLGRAGVRAASRPSGR